MRSPDAKLLDREYALLRARECSSLGASLVACATAAGLDFDKQVSVGLGVDKAQLSRWQGNTEGIREHRFLQLQAFCGNSIPLLYLTERCGYDASSIRVRETQLEKENRELREERDMLRRFLIDRG